MFNADFYPTPTEVIEQLCFGIETNGKTILEPSAGSGNIVEWLKGVGADVIACEKHPDLQKIIQRKCKLLAADFLTVTADQVSHIDAIIMNPPFSADEQHILHAFEIAPAGCNIHALCNYETYSNAWSGKRKQLRTIIDTNGNIANLGTAFDTAERTTHTKIGLIRIKKPGTAYETEFTGFFMDEEVEQQDNAILPYNFARDLVNRYINAIKLFDEQLLLGQKMNLLTASFFTSNIAFNITSADAPITRNNFKKDLQKSAWNWVFAKMNMQKTATKGLKEDINKFVEQQINVPFTMKNIYKMIEIVIGTTGSRMDKALLEVFDKLTDHYHENRYNVAGWKTNSHYLVNEKFILPYMMDSWGGLSISHGNNSELIEDFVKALCHITGKNYDDLQSLRSRITKYYRICIDGKIVTEQFAKVSNLSYPTPLSIDSHHKAEEYVQTFTLQGYKNIEILQPAAWGEWLDWHYFQVKCFKKGTIHFKFKSRDTWATFNQHIARIKGYPLPEGLKK